MLLAEIKVLWIITLIIWGLTSILSCYAEKKKAEAVERQAMSTYLLQKEIKRLNDRIECKACVGESSEKRGER